MGSPGHVLDWRTPEMGRDHDGGGSRFIRSRSGIADTTASADVVFDFVRIGEQEDPRERRTSMT